MKTHGHNATLENVQKILDLENFQKMLDLENFQRILDLENFQKILDLAFSDLDFENVSVEFELRIILCLDLNNFELNFRGLDFENYDEVELELKLY